MNPRFLGIIILGLILMSSSCAKEDEFPIIPEIEMSSKQEYSDPTSIIINFTDGDGDIGLDEGDTLPPYDFNEDDFNKFYYNLLLYYFERHDTGWVEVETAVPYYYRVPNLTPTGQNKSLNGEIKVDITLSTSRPDSIRFDIELIDRALHVSNRLTTPAITY